MEELKQSLADLRLRGFADNLEQRVKDAMDSGVSYTEFLQMLVEDEKARRSTNAFKQRLKLSGLKPGKTLANYKFALQPAIDQKQINQLATCEFIKTKEKIIFIGQSGVGKSHLANALGLKALEKAYSVFRFNANDLAEQLLMAKKEGGHQEMVSKILKANFIIWDEFAIRPFPYGGLEELFALLEKIDETTAIAFTSNRDFSDWQPFFADHTIVSAFTDRAVNKATIIKIIGNSFRLKNSERQISEPVGELN